MVKASRRLGALGAPCEPFGDHQEFGTVFNDVQLLSGFFRVAVTARLGGPPATRIVGFDLDRCDFNKDAVVVELRAPKSSRPV